MKRKLILLTAMLFLGYGFSAKAAGMDEQFNKFKEKLVTDMWKVYPAWASSIGYHKYDSVLVIPDDKSRANELAFCKKQLDGLKGYNVSTLSEANKTDYYLIENQMKYAIWGIEEMKAYQWDPSGYNVSGSFADMLANNYEPINTRLRNFYKRMAGVPAYYQAAKLSIKSPVIEHTILAVEQNTGGKSVFQKDLPDALNKSTLPEAEKVKILERGAQCVEAINDYTQWLKNMENIKPRSFRLGPELYKKKFEFEIQSGFTAEEIFDKAEEHKKELHKKMMDITTTLWPKYFAGTPVPGNPLEAIRLMIDKLSLNHVRADEFQSAIEKQIPHLIAFIKHKNLIYIDPAKPLVVRKEPDYMAGVAGASINAPGPYDKNGNTYYNVGSLEGWDTAKAESYLREYNHYILQILNIHEAIPGHYTQLVYANQSPSIIKSILGNSAMIEGWAVYTERMMLENGYDGDLGMDANEATPEMWLMYYKWNLRSTCNTILDYKVHTQNMSINDAMSLLIDEAFQQRAEASGKWKRVSVTQVQLCCYFTGYTEIYSLRDEIKSKQGAKFDLKKFHEQFLSYGSAPVKYIRKAMLVGVK